MNRRHFLQLGLAGAASTLSGCFLPSCYWVNGCHKSGPNIHYFIHNTRVKVYYGSDTMVMLAPDFHLVIRYKLPRVFFNLPAGMLQKAYLKHGSEKNQDRAFNQENTKLATFNLNLLWKTADLNAKEKQLLEAILREQEAARYKSDFVFKYQLSVEKGKLADAQNFHNFTAKTENIDMNKYVPALRNKEEEIYQIRQLAGAVNDKAPYGQLYAAGSYPNGFFDGARQADYVAEKRGNDALSQPYPWQTRKSPVKIDAQGRVTLYGRELVLLNARSPFA